MEDIQSLTDLIEQIIKINNRISQRERANKGSNKTIPVYKAPQQVQKLQYGGAELIDLSSI